MLLDKEALMEQIVYITSDGAAFAFLVPKEALVDHNCWRWYLSWMVEGWRWKEDMLGCPCSLWSVSVEQVAFCANPCNFMMQAEWCSLTSAEWTATGGWLSSGYMWSSLPNHYLMATKLMWAPLSLQQRSNLRGHVQRSGTRAAVAYNEKWEIKQWQPTLKLFEVMTSRKRFIITDKAFLS